MVVASVQYVDLYTLLLLLDKYFKQELSLCHNCITSTILKLMIDDISFVIDLSYFRERAKVRIFRDGAFSLLPN